MILTLTGMPGSGKSTVAKVLAEKLLFTRYYTGQIMRDIAKEKGMDLVTYLQYLETHPAEEIEIDAKVEALKSQDNIIVESRTAFHLIPHSFKVFLDVSESEGAKRILNELHQANQRNERSYASLKEAMDTQRTRFLSDHKRYRALYGIDMLDRSNYDLVIDTSNLTVQQVVDKILERMKVSLKER